MVNVEVLLDSPAAELIKQNESTVIGIDFLEGLIRVSYLDSPLSQDRSCHIELLLADPPVLARVDGAECTPILIVLSQIEKQIFELRLRNVVVSVGIV